MYVWAIPVGHAVIAMIEALGAGSAAGAAGAGVAGAAVAAGAGLTTPSTSATTSSAVPAARSCSTKSLRTRARARLDSSFMCSAPPDSGAAMRNARSAGPSGAPNGTAGARRAKPMVGSSTWGDRQCGIAMPPGSPVADWDSRARAASTSPSPLVARPVSAIRAASSSITFCLSGPASTSSATRSEVMIGMGVPSDRTDQRWAEADVTACTRTAFTSIWFGLGSAEPGREAAALPYATAVWSRCSGAAPAMVAAR